MISNCTWARPARTSGGRSLGAWIQRSSSASASETTSGGGAQTLHFPGGSPRSSFVMSGSPPAAGRHLARHASAVHGPGTAIDWKAAVPWGGATPGGRIPEQRRSCRSPPRRPCGLKPESPQIGPHLRAWPASLQSGRKSPLPCGQIHKETRSDWGLSAWRPTVVPPQSSRPHAGPTAPLRSPEEDSPAGGDGGQTPELSHRQRSAGDTYLWNAACYESPGPGKALVKKSLLTPTLSQEFFTNEIPPRFSGAKATFSPSARRFSPSTGSPHSLSAASSSFSSGR